MLRQSDGPVTLGRQASGVRRQAKTGEDVVSAETIAPSAMKRPRKRRVARWTNEKRDVCAAIADAAKRHNAPPLQAGGYEQLVSIIGSLLNGGYDLALIRRVAVEAALDYDEIRRYSKLFQLRMRVRAAQTAIDATERERIKRELNDAVVQADPAVAKALIGVAQRMLRGRDTIRAEVGK